MTSRKSGRISIGVLRCKTRNDAERLRVDTAMRYEVGGRAKEKLGAATSEMSRFETEVLTQMKQESGKSNERL